MGEKKYTDNQIRAIKRIQWLSHTDEEFQTKMGCRRMTFKEVINCGLWTLEDLEHMGETLVRVKYDRFHILNSGKRFKRHNSSRLSQNEQFLRKSRSLNMRYDKPIHRPIT